MIYIKYCFDLPDFKRNCTFILPFQYEVFKRKLFYV